jgi:hypothetical protein
MKPRYRKNGGNRGINREEREMKITVLSQILAGNMGDGCSLEFYQGDLVLYIDRTHQVMMRTQDLADLLCR